MLVDKIDQHVPLAAVAGRIRQQESHQPAVHFLPTPSSVDDIVQEVVGSFDLVPVEQVRLGELELVQIVLLDEGNADAVQCSKQPATAGTLLIRQRFAFVLNLQ